jgi:GrpB-like predicted nucleotidyltransferase (UPF0157 family)
VTGEADAPIGLVPYNAAWPAKFQQERNLLKRTIGFWAVDGIHHVGSTAVAGLLAKPIIDILVGVRRLQSSRECFGALEQLGYLYAPYKPEEMHWFCKPDPSCREYHLHLAPVDSDRYRDELSFRDQLRASSEIAREYADVKQSLATRFANDREAYTEAKSDFIARVLASREPRGARRA